jgi:hypothetical protein
MKQSEALNKLETLYINFVFIVQYALFYSSGITRACGRWQHGLRSLHQSNRPTSQFAFLSATNKFPGILSGITVLCRHDCLKLRPQSD